MNRVKKELPKYKHAWPLLYFFIYLPWFLILEHKEIAEQLGLSVYTVQDHIKNALEKIRAYLIPFISACPILVSLIILKYVKP